MAKTFDKPEMEDQKSRDRRMRSVNRNNIRSGQIRRIKCMKNIIQDLERHGPAGLIHIDSLSDIICRPIRIWNADGSLNRIIGKGEIEQAIDIEYHVTQSGSIGHWTLRNSKEPMNAKMDLNSCLFTVIGSQTGYNPLRLRSWTVLKLKRNLEMLINQINEFIHLAKNDEIRLMIGGACYRGTSAADARIILDKSQNRPSHGFNTLGHARGHASYSPVNGEYDSVEAYSSKNPGKKSAFLSRDDQDMVAHLVLKSDTVQKAMSNLNLEGKLNETVYVVPEDIREIAEGTVNLPKMNEYLAGKAVYLGKGIESMIIILRHHVNEHRNPNADVYVFTFYPRSYLTKYK